MILRKAVAGAGWTCVCVAMISLHAAAATSSTPFGGTAVVLPGTVEAENFDDGGQYIAYYDTAAGNKGGVYRATDVDLQPSTDLGGGYTVGWTKAGEWLNYTVDVAATATYTLETRVANIGTGATFHVEVDGVNLTRTIVVPDTGAWDAWQTLTTSGLPITAGRHVLRVVFDTMGTGGAVGGFNWFRVTAAPLPSPWTSRDIGNSAPAGMTTYANSAFTVVGGGADIWGSADAFQFVSQPAPGDTQIVVRVMSLQNTSASAKAGVMLRESTAADAAHVILDVEPSGNVEFMTRKSTGAATNYLAGTTVALPAWLKLSRIGATIVGSVSNDGIAWRQVGVTTASATLGLTGMAVTSHATTLNTSLFDNVTVAAPVAPLPPAPSALTAVAPMIAAVGVPTTTSLSWSGAGATGYDVMFGTSNPPPIAVTGLTTATYAPAALSNGTTYYWQIAARNAGGTTTSAVWSFTTIVAAPAAPAVVTPSNAASSIAVNTPLSWSAPGATTYDVNFGTTNPPPPAASGLAAPTYTPATLINNTTYFWQVVARNAGGATAGPVWSFTTIVAPPTTPTVVAPANSSTGIATNASLAWSANGATRFDVNFGTTNPPPAAATGLAAPSYTPVAALNTLTTYYWQVVAQNDGGATAGPVWSFTTAALPSQWTSQDIGTVVLPGSASYSNGAFTIAGAGADIWYNADAFQFVSQAVSGDTEIVARVASVTNTNTKAKAGVMLRESIAPEAAHVLVDVKPNGGGVEFITRATTGGQTTKQSNTALSAPVYLRLRRTGTTVVGAASTDGVNWITVGTTTIAAWPLAGLAVTSRDITRLNTAVFDNVTITVPPPTPPPTSTGSSPGAYIAVTDRTAYPKPALPHLGPAGFTFNDPTFGSKILRVTDEFTRPGSPYRSYRASSNGQLAAWNASSTAFYVVSNDGTIIPFAFDAQTMTAARIQATTTGSGGATLGFYQEPQFSLVNPNIIYGAVTGTNNRTVGQYDFQTQKYSPIVDMDTIVSGLANTYLGVVMTGGAAPEKLMTLFGGGSQDNHYLLMWSPIDNLGARKILNTVTSTINGVPTNVTLNVHLHSALIDMTGRYVLLGTRASDIAAPRSAAPVFVWDTATDVITPLPTSMLSSGHGILGHGTWINQDCCTSSTWDGMQWQFRYLNDLQRTSDLVSPVLLPKEIYIADHTSWHNSRPDTLVPVISSTYRSTIDTDPWRAWDDEIIAIDTAGGGGGLTYRFAHHRSDIRSDTDPSVNYFWYQPISSVSPDGRFVIFTSNWEKTLGKDAAEGTFRQDVFLVQLTPR